MELTNYILKILTFPGAFLKAFLEQLACRMYEVPIEFGRYFQKNELCGHVEHLLAPKKGSFGICFLPHIIMLFCGLVFTIPAALNLVYLGKINYFGIIFLYVGISCFLNLFPLIEDSLNMWEHLYGKESKATAISKICLFLPAVIMRAGSYLEHYFVTVLTTAAFVWGVPYLFTLFIR